VRRPDIRARVPLTTWIACWFASNSRTFGALFLAQERASANSRRFSAALDWWEVTRLRDEVPYLIKLNRSSRCLKLKLHPS